MSGEKTNATGEISWREKGSALYHVARFQPKFAAGVTVLSVLAALLEGFGLSFILPIVELAQGEVDPAETGGLLGTFADIYAFLGLPFTMGYLVGGVVAIMSARYISSFLVAWFRAAIETRYVRHLQEEAFESALGARVTYFDEEGSDDILNAIVTQAEYAGRVIRYSIMLIEQVLLALMYLAIALYLAPVLTVIAAAFLGSMTVLFRNVLGSGYSVGSEVADAKEDIQSHAQMGTQGIRDVKLFGMIDELRSGFSNAVDSFERHQIRLRRNEAAITNFYRLSTAITIFVLIYAAIVFSGLGVGALGVFLFAMFRLGPQVSHINQRIYRIEGELPHLVRTQSFIAELQRNRERTEPGRPVPDPIDTIAFEGVSFGYEGSEQVLRDVSFGVDSGEFVGFVGPSGAGKSTIVSLLARLYEPDGGAITANGRRIDEYDLDEWRRSVSVVRQDPHVFDDTLRRNITIGRRDATDEEVRRVCEIAQVTEFVDRLPRGYESRIGDQGVKLSGGQRQRVAVARALLKDADLLILDEATSDLDSNIEAKVHRAIESMDRDYAMLVIAHRLSTVVNADRIHAMKEGRIVEIGSHDSLVERDGLYADLFDTQTQ